VYPFARYLPEADWIVVHMPVNWVPVKVTDTTLIATLVPEAEDVVLEVEDVEVVVVVDELVVDEGVDVVVLEDVDVEAVIEEEVEVVAVVAAWTSTASSSHCSPPPLAAQPQVTRPADEASLELDAPVIALGRLASHCCPHVEEPSVTLPYIDGRSRTQLFGYFVVIDIAGLLLAEPEFPKALAGIGFAWSTPEKAYAPATAEVEPVIVITMFAIPVGLRRYQNSASLLWNETTRCVSGAPPKVMEDTY
jgi:hypothetical protein